jgi:hypothetical protein
LKITCITIEQYSKKVTNKLLGAEDTAFMTGSSVAGVPKVKRKSLKEIIS